MHAWGLPPPLPFVVLLLARNASRSLPAILMIAVQNNIQCSFKKHKLNLLQKSHKLFLLDVRRTLLANS